ncbi:MAG: thiamine phosphate synthase, partial [Sneathiella sp.]
MQNTVAFYFTDETVGADPLEVIPLLPARSGVIFRHYNLDNRENLASKVAKLCKKYEISLSIAADPKLAHSLKASGCHLPEHTIHQAPLLKQKFPNLFLTAACHSERAVHLASRYQCDAAFLSPIFPT